MPINNAEHQCPLTRQDILYYKYDDVYYVWDGIVRYDHKADVPGMTKKDWRILGGTRHYINTIYHLFRERRVLYLHDIGLDMLEHHVGRPYTELLAAIDERYKNSPYHQELKRWDTLRAEFDGYILKVDEVDFYATGVTISLLLNSMYSYEEQYQYISKHTKKIFRYMCGNLTTMEGSKYAPKQARQKAADLLPYCTAEEIVVTRRNTLAFKFSLKPDIIEILESEKS